uniref:Zinc finger protein 346 n=1 Tax=Erpetoichthys calabaricus TaxID=27687 RepID=A0A8C4SBY8_ERPCA
MDGDTLTGDFLFEPVGKAEVNRMIKDNCHMFSDTHCKVCSAVLISESQKLAHYQGKKHANKVRRYISIHKDEEPLMKRVKLQPEETKSNGEVDRSKACPLCNMTFSSPVVAESHYQGKVHSKNLKLNQQVILAQAKPTAASKKKSSATGIASEEGASNDPDKFCSICHTRFNNPLMAKQHYVGKKHKKQITKVKLMEHYGPSTTLVKGYQCTLCKIELNSVEQYQAHISGAKHKNHLSNSAPLQSPPSQRRNSQKKASSAPTYHSTYPPHGSQSFVPSHGSQSFVPSHGSQSFVPSHGSQSFGPSHGSQSFLPSPPRRVSSQRDDYGMVSEAMSTSFSFPRLGNHEPERQYPGVSQPYFSERYRQDLNRRPADHTMHPSLLRTVPFSG